MWVNPILTLIPRQICSPAFSSWRILINLKQKASGGRPEAIAVPEHGYEKDESKMIKVTYEVSAEGMGIVGLQG